MLNHKDSNDKNLNWKQWVNKLNKNRNKYKATIANEQQGSNTQWQHKQQSNDNHQKSKIHRKTRTTMEWIKKRINSGNINSKVMTTNKKVKYIEKPEQLQLNELKSE